MEAWTTLIIELGVRAGPAAEDGLPRQAGEGEGQEGVRGRVVGKKDAMILFEFGPRLQVRNVIPASLHQILTN